VKRRQKNYSDSLQLTLFFQNEEEKASKERQIATQRQGNIPSVKQLIASPDKGSTAEKVAEIFPTNEKYVKNTFGHKNTSAGMLFRQLHEELMTSINVCAVSN